MLKNSGSLLLIYLVMFSQLIFCSASSSQPLQKTQDLRGWYFNNRLENEVLIESHVGEESGPNEVVVPCSPQQTVFVRIKDPTNPVLIKAMPEGYCISCSHKELGETSSFEDAEYKRFIIQENELAKARIEILAEDERGILVCNRMTTSEKFSGEIFYCWYLTQGASHSRLTVPKSIKPGFVAMVYNPSTEGAQIAIALRSEWLQQKKVDDRCHIKDVKDSMSDASRELLVTGNSDKQLMLLPHKSAFELINTTNMKLFYSLFAQANNENRDKRIAWVSHQLGPQESTRISREGQLQNLGPETYKYIVLYVSQEELHAQNLKGVEVVAKVATFDLSYGCTMPKRLLITRTFDKGECPFVINVLEESSISVLPIVVEKFEKSAEKKNLSRFARLHRLLADKIPGSLPSLNMQIVTEAEIGTLEKEKLFLQVRKNKIWESIYSFVGGAELSKVAKELGFEIEENKVLEMLKGFPCPKVGLALSGGNYLSMIDAIGFLSAVYQESVFDCCAYMTGTSGASLAITSLVASHKTPKEFEQAQKKNLTQQASHMKPDGDDTVVDLMKMVVDNKDYVSTLALQCLYHQPQGVIGFFGHALASKLLKDVHISGRNMHDITFSDLQHNLSTGEYPLPICSAADCIDVLSNDQRYFEFNPFYITNYRVGMEANKQGLSIPTEAFGSLFKDGAIIQAAPEYPLAQLFGIWGFSACSVPESMSLAASPMREKMQTQKEKAKKYLRNTFRLEDQDQVSLGGVPNYLFASQKGEVSRPRSSSRQQLCLGDAQLAVAGDMSHAFAILPLLARDIDLIIMYDATSAAKEENSLKHLVAAEKEANSLCLPFQKIFPEELADQPAVFLQEDSKAPALLYLKAKKHVNNISPNKYLKHTSFSCTSEDYTARMKDSWLDVTTAPIVIAQIRKGMLEAVRRTLQKNRIVTSHK